jgi:hypothetical protein
LEVLKLAAKKAGHAPVNAALIREAAAEIAPSPMKTKPAAPENIKIDLKGFLGWIEILKAFAAGDNKAEVMRLLEKAATDKTIAPEPELNFAAFVNPHRPAVNPNPQIHLYGRKNEKDVPDGERCYWTDFETWCAGRKAVTASEPFYANVTSDSTDLFFRCCLARWIVTARNAVRNGNQSRQLALRSLGSFPKFIRKSLMKPASLKM